MVYKRLLGWLLGGSLVIGFSSAIAWEGLVAPAMAQAEPETDELPLKMRLVDPPAELEEIELTSEQWAQIREIQQEMQAELSSSGLLPSLTEQQQTQAENGEKIQISTTNLSAEQQEQLDEIAQSYRQKVASVLTPAQQQRFLQNLSDLLFEVVP